MDLEIWEQPVVCGYKNCSFGIWLEEMGAWGSIEEDCSSLAPRSLGELVGCELNTVQHLLPFG